MNILLLRELWGLSIVTFEEHGLTDCGDGGGEGNEDIDEDNDVVDADTEDEENGDIDGGWLVAVGVVGGVGGDDDDDEEAGVVLLDDGDETVESCSWMNIIWSPSLMVKFRGERPAKKLSTWKDK